MELFNSDTNTRTKLGQILIRKNLITSEQLNSILNQQQKTKKKLGELLLENGLISAEELEKALQMPFVKFLVNT